MLCACMRACVCVCVCVRVCVCACVRACVRVCVRARTPCMVCTAASAVHLVVSCTAVSLSDVSAGEAAVARQ